MKKVSAVIKNIPPPSRIMALDPGHTLGYAMVDWELTIPTIAPVIREAQNIALPMNNKRSLFDWEQVSLIVSHLIDKEPDVIVLEEYIVYRSKANVHIGARLIVSELIGAICQEAAISMIPVVRLMAGVKKNWPIARLNSRFTLHRQAPSPHSHDALLLALCYIEKTLGWKPQKQGG